MKKQLFFVVLSMLALLLGTSCSQDLETIGSTDVGGIAADLKNNYVFALKPTTQSGIETRASVNKNYRWDNYSIINIAFLNGSTIAQNKVKEIAQEWQKLINLKFVYTTDILDADVKIGFKYNGDRVNWSSLGTECWDYWGTDEPTMNILLNDENSAAELNTEDFSGVVLRLFGHMLGLLYEHQGPNAALKLDETKTYAYFKPFGWTEDAIDSYILKLYNTKQANPSTPVYDENSIMNLFIPSHLAASSDNTTGTNRYITVLSDMDKEFIASIYPRPEYVPGAEGSVYLVIPTGENGGYGLLGWNFDTETQQAWGNIEKTYKTIEVGEYVWTAENLKLKYWNLWSTLYEFMNHTQAKINTVTGTNNVYTVKQFEDVFGTWTNCYQEAKFYKDKFKFYTIKGGTEIQGFNLPDKNDVLQLIGQMPIKTGNMYKDFIDFTFANTDAVKKLSSNSIADQNLTFGSPYISNSSNTSQLNLTPLGFKGNEPDDSGQHYSFGYGLGLQMREDGRMLYAGDISGLVVNQYLYHFCQARYCRQMTATERGYELYIDEANDQVVAKKPAQSATGLTILPIGLERGIALRSFIKDDMIVIDSWSSIKAEAARIRASISIQ
ncbi:zinc metalloprotease [Dysgonomonas macrotermitis]|uniref:Astacin (Peptidase family M12A) n=1 Tax=Dysgonomonas macrotermitis TaxID=1346286 RepID=A0A1M4YNM6_9BACT|nr:hypothetical protein [Dysgonomonas macrotermitis]SHF06996.1 hypothetical protein SAMN05444362_103218 [Dysgonomonas macrotermitis]